MLGAGAAYIHSATDAGSVVAKAPRGRGFKVGDKVDALRNMPEDTAAASKHLLRTFTGCVQLFC
jgi:hypothetical protein